MVKKKNFLEMTMDEKDDEITRRKQKGLALTKEQQAYVQGCMDTNLKMLQWKKSPQK